MKKVICGLIMIFILIFSATGFVTANASQSKPALAENVIKPRLEYDYYGYINADLLAKIQIPSDEPGWSYFYQLDQNVYKSLDEILQETVRKKDDYAIGSTEQKIAALYLSAMDLNGRERAQLGALQPYLNSIKAAATVQEYAEATLKLTNDLLISSALEFYFAPDLKDSLKYACYIEIPNLGLGKETLEDATQTELVRSYEHYVAQVLRAGGLEEKEARQAAIDIIALQKDLAASALTLGDSNDPGKIYNKYTLDELQGLLPSLDIKAALTAGDMLRREYIVKQPNVIKKFNSYMTQEHLPLLKNYSMFCLLNETAECLTPELRNLSLEWSRKQTGAAQVKSDQKLASQLVQGLLGFEFGKLYVERHFSEADKQDVKTLISELIATYEKKIDALDWMSNATKIAAKKKLQTMDIKIGYPDTWPDYFATARVRSPQEGGSLIDNIIALRSSQAAFLQRLYKNPVDRKQWNMIPQTVNAYYNPTANEIVFPAGILQAPFYDRNADKMANLGGIGVVIAHEISHAFDNAGAQYDENGNNRQWWTTKDQAGFERKTRMVVDYYNDFTIVGGKHVNGAQTLGENIADLGAMSCVTTLAGDDPQQLRILFTQFAIIWAGKYSEEYQVYQLNNDTHSPLKIRVNAATSASEAFYIAYPNIKPGDKMYLPPQKRVKIW